MLSNAADYHFLFFFSNEKKDILSCSDGVCTCSVVLLPDSDQAM